MDRENLTAEDQASLGLARDWVKRHFGEGADAYYATVAGKLRILDSILSEPGTAMWEKSKWEYLGVTLGDALAQELSLEWVIAIDEFGRAPALNWPGTSLMCHPISMVSNRLEDGEDVDVDDLFALTAMRLTELAPTARLQ